MCRRILPDKPRFPQPESSLGFTMLHRARLLLSEVPVHVIEGGNNQ